jgi:poly[(R)-3-hydroxyalkanoate] polymerase subunit PhaC
MPNAMDPFAISEAFEAVLTAWRQDQEACRERCQALQSAMLSITDKVMTRLRADTPPDTGDSETVLLRWVRNLAWSGQLYHQAFSEWAADYIAKAPKVKPEQRIRAQFWMRQLTEMLAPANFFWANPKAVQRFIQSRGESLNKGLRNWLEDFQSNPGLVSLADRTTFELGRNLAATPGHVVYRNHLMELIQYSPQTASVWQVPIVFIQPWINKYYIFDLAAQNSFVAHLVREGHTVFITSWKNPGPEMRGTTLEDYLFHGALQAVTVARRVCQTDHVHAAGYCIGGTLLAVLLAWLAQSGNSQPIVDAALFASLLDFSTPGALGALIQPASVEAISRLASSKGILENRHIAMSFRMLNPNDLIWRYVVNNYFYGEPPPRSDMLYWNSDGTNLPAAMCISYLQWFYLENRLVKPDALVIGGRAIDLGKVRQPMYVVGSAKDHICPWPSTFQTCRLTAGRMRYVLADEGHITGIVNPPSPWSKKQFWAGTASRRRDAHKWLEKQAPQKGSWWPDWIAWLKPRSGDQVHPPNIGCKDYPALEPAPGTYVLE